ncbi:hypothetical protein ACOJ0Y_07165 [Morganella morganii]|nr:hypothetical protein [Morganella morganii]MBT0405527.1 hypothetical protein [Morganella morganii subsp. morganii]
MTNLLTSQLMIFSKKIIQIMMPIPYFLLLGCGSTINSVMEGYNSKNSPNLPTKAEFEKTFNSAIGFTDLELTQKLGVPVSSHETGGHLFFVYIDNHDVFIPGGAPNYKTTSYGNTLHTTVSGGTSERTIKYICKITFESVNNRIVDYNYYGNGCVSDK